MDKIKRWRPTRTKTKTAVPLSWSNVDARGGSKRAREIERARVQRAERRDVPSYLPRVVNIIHEPLALFLVLRIDVGHCGSPCHQKGCMFITRACS